MVAGTQCAHRADGITQEVYEEACVVYIVSVKRETMYDLQLYLMKLAVPFIRTVATEQEYNTIVRTLICRVYKHWSPYKYG